MHRVGGWRGGEGTGAVLEDGGTMNAESPSSLVDDFRSSLTGYVTAAGIAMAGVTLDVPVLAREATGGRHVHQVATNASSQELGLACSPAELSMKPGHAS